LSCLNRGDWSYYAKGIDIASIKIDFEAVTYREKQMLFGMSNDYKDIKEINVTGEVPIFLFPFDTLKECYKGYESADFSKDNFGINDLLTYEKHYEINGVVNDTNQKGVVWSQVNDKIGPLDIVTVNDEIICFFMSNGLGTEYLVRTGYENVTPLKEWFESKVSESGCGVFRYIETMIVMGDGVRLSTEVWLPGTYKVGDKFPVIFMRTPYGKKRNAKRDANYCDRGYALVIQDVRGREDSEGEFIAMYHEKNDGSDSLDWIASQTWCDGNIGMMGASYGGYVQWAAAASGNKKLKAIVSQVSAGSPFSDVERRGGGYNMGIIEWNIMMSEKKVKWELGEVDWETELKKRPIIEIPQNITGKNLKFWDIYMDHPHYDDFWKQMTFSDFSENIDVPALVVSGWHDGDLNGTVEIYGMNQCNNRANQRLILGPWEHHYNTRRQVGEYKLGKNAVRYNMDLLYLKWLDRFLKGIENGIENTKVEFYPESLNQWIRCESWPPENSEIKKYFLKVNREVDDDFGLLVSDNLKIEPENQLAFKTYNYDPNNPAPQLYDLKTRKPFTPIDYSELEEREDVLIFTSAPFLSDQMVVGKPSVKLFASSSAIDTDWVVRLTRVTEDGKSYRITEKLLRAKYRNGFENPEYLEPNKIEAFTIELPYVGQLIRKGEKIRLQITSAQYGEMFPNSNTGKNPAYDMENIIATQNIYTCAAYQSQLELSMIEVESF